jgi:hypothetical protein
MHWQELALHYLLMSFYKGFSTGWKNVRRWQLYDKTANSCLQ